MAELLSKHPVFKKLAIDPSPSAQNGASPSTWRIPLNLLAYDATTSRLFLWNSSDCLLHALDIEQPDPSELAADLSTSLFAKKTFKTFQPLLDVDFSVRFITLSISGGCVILAGDHALAVVELQSQVHKPSASPDNLFYSVRASTIGGNIFQKTSKSLLILQVAWHPFGHTHIGVLSADGVFRLFDLSRNVEYPEQEYHLQSQLLERSTYARPVAFSFGGGHLWDRFAVFLLYSDGSIYALCPISPFGSLHNVPAIEELYRDACQWASSTSIDSKATSCAGFAAAWLEAVFPTLSLESGPANALLFKAVAYVPFNASLRLQGPLPVIMGEDIAESKISGSKGRSPASMLMYSTVGKDSILAVSFRDGEMHLYALADEVQPVWNDNAPPRLQINNEGSLVAVGMLVETYEDVNTSNSMLVKDDAKEDESIVGNIDGIWTGQLLPLLQLAVIDFALPLSVLESAPLCMFGDQVVPDRIYCHHAAGIDAILLQWLPFSGQSVNRTSSGKPPTVHPILDTCPAGKSDNSPLLGITQVYNCYGEVWLVAVTASCECAVLGVKHFLALDPFLPVIDGKKSADEEAEFFEGDVTQVISKELLKGPKDIPIPQVSYSGKPLTLDTIEGKELLHDQWKLLHEKYIEYVHRVHVELKIHARRLDKDVQDHHKRLCEAQTKLAEAFQASNSLNSKIAAAAQKNQNMKERLKKHRTLMAKKQMPLTASEREYMSQLDVMRLHDLEILHTAVDVLKDRFERLSHLSQASGDHCTGSHKMVARERGGVPAAQINKLKAAINASTQMVEKLMKQVKRIDDAVEIREQSDDSLYI